MKRSLQLFGLLLLGASLARVLGQEEISSPAKRQTTLDLATRLLTTEEKGAASLPADLVDPFNPAGFGAPVAGPTKPGEAVHAVATDRDILQKIAAQITPSGMMLFGGQPLLLFREKKLKVGDSLTITFEGTDYVVVITAIDQTSFKIRLNREEITRPIKPGKAP
ncbi:MAG TPA: hypothetical protein VMJ30_01625 [Gemmatimonadales bacterium]|nr:hypothetical protein [Gemmatimonadales bacterium]